MRGAFRNQELGELLSVALRVSPPSPRSLLSPQRALMRYLNPISISRRCGQAAAARARCARVPPRAKKKIQKTKKKTRSSPRNTSSKNTRSAPRNAQHSSCAKTRAKTLAKTSAAPCAGERLRGYPGAPEPRQLSVGRAPIRALLPFSFQPGKERGREERRRRRAALELCALRPLRGRGAPCGAGQMAAFPRSVPGFSLTLLFCSSGTRLVLLPREALLGQKENPVNRRNRAPGGIGLKCILI